MAARAVPRSGDYPWQHRHVTPWKAATGLVWGLVCCAPPPSPAWAVIALLISGALWACYQAQAVTVTLRFYYRDELPVAGARAHSVFLAMLDLYFGYLVAVGNVLWAFLAAHEGTLVAAPQWEGGLSFEEDGRVGAWLAALYTAVAMTHGVGFVPFQPARHAALLRAFSALAMLTVTYWLWLLLLGAATASVVERARWVGARAAAPGDKKKPLT